MRPRLVLFLVGALGGILLLAWGLWGLPGFGHYRGPYGNQINARAAKERHSSSAVAPVVFDYRGFDTVGEELILFAAVMGVIVLLRAQREEHEEPARLRTEELSFRVSESSRVVALALIPPTVVLGLYVVVHGHLSPGGGFQGGVALAAAGVLLYLAGEYLSFQRVYPVALLDLGEAGGAGGFIVIGLVGLFTGAAYLSNVFPLGITGTLFSAGTIPVINVFVGVEVAVGIVFMVYEFVEQTLLVRRRSS